MQPLELKPLCSPGSFATKQVMTGTLQRGKDVDVDSGTLCARSAVC